MERLTDLVVQAACEALDQPVQASDNFFAVGGNSLQATHLVTLIEDVTGVKMDLVEVFEAPEFASLARRILELKTGDSRVSGP
jgi:acyl carrier protein